MKKVNKVAAAEAEEVKEEKAVVDTATGEACEDKSTFKVSRTVTLKDAKEYEALKSVFAYANTQITQFCFVGNNKILIKADLRKITTVDYSANVNNEG